MQPKLVCNLCAFPPIWDTTLRRAPSWHWMTKSHGSQKTRLLINGIFRERSWSKGEKCKKIINQKPQLNRVGSQRRSSHLWQQHSPRGRRETFPSWQQLSQGKTMDFLFSVALPTSFSSLWRLSPSLAVWGFGVALHSCRSQITILYCPSNHLCWRNIFSLFVLGQHQNDEDICKALHQRHLAKSKKSLQREKHLCMAWGLGWFRKRVAQCAKWTVELYFHFWPTWDQEESQKLTLLACSVRTVFLSPFPHHISCRTVLPQESSTWFSWWENKRVVLLSWSWTLSRALFFWGEGQDNQLHLHGLQEEEGDIQGFSLGTGG